MHCILFFLPTKFQNKFFLVSPSPGVLRKGLKILIHADKDNAHVSVNF